MTTADPVFEAALVRARPSRPAGARLAHAQITGALFHGSISGRFGRFHVRERLGAGGMGVVYAAHDPKLDRRVALKLVRVAANDHEAAVAEAQTLAQLSHPNVVPIYDVGIDGEDVFLVMELVRGPTLRRWVVGKNWRAIVGVYRQAGTALAAAHRAGLVHRDFKPDNAIVGADGRVRVVDFGLACRVHNTGSGSRERTGVAGTLRYMAPEQLAGSAATPAADQYSFCVALGEALAGCTLGGVPRWIEMAVQRGRSLDPDARFASMRELVRVLSGDPRRARLRGLGIAVLASAVGIAAFVAGAARRGRPAFVFAAISVGRSSTYSSLPSCVPRRCEAGARRILGRRRAHRAGRSVPATGGKAAALFALGYPERAHEFGRWPFGEPARRWGAVASGDLVAYAGLWRVHDDRFRMDLVVDAELRGRGIGDRVLEHPVDAARAERGVTALKLRQLGAARPWAAVCCVRRAPDDELTLLEQALLSPADVEKK